MKTKKKPICALIGSGIVLILIGTLLSEKWKAPKMKRYFPKGVSHIFRSKEKHQINRRLEYFRQQPKSKIVNDYCRNVEKQVDSKTVPPFFPFEGIGRDANISETEYETSHFRTFCNRNMTAIVQIYSAAQNFDRRKAIRETIGKQCLLAGCKVMFVVAISLDENIVQKVKEEYTEKGDMFVQAKVDTYNDLPNKAMAMLDWLLEYCTQPRYVLQLIDDAFINVDHFIQEMDAIKDTDRYFFGKVFKQQRPHRNVESIYYVSKEIYPYDKYPDFVVGISAAFPNSLTRELRCAVHRARYVWMADVWLMGEIKEYLDLKLVSTRYATPDKEQLKLDRIAQCLYVHHTGPADFYRFQTALESKTTKQ